MRLYKRGSTWWCSFYENGQRSRRSTQCHDRKAAEAVARGWERDAADPAHAITRSTTLSDALNLLLRERSEQAMVGRRSHDTVDLYRRKAGHLLRVFEVQENGDRTPFLLAALHARHVDGYISRRRGESASENTIYKELVTLRAALRLARRAGIWTGEPAAIIPIAFAPEYKPRTRALSADELKLLLSELLPDQAARVAFIVATSACWRETELAQRDDVTPDAPRRSSAAPNGRPASERFRS